MSDSVADVLTRLRAEIEVLGSHQWREADLTALRALAQSITAFCDLQPDYVILTDILAALQAEYGETLIRVGLADIGAPQAPLPQHECVKHALQLATTLREALATLRELAPPSVWEVNEPFLRQKELVVQLGSQLLSALVLPNAPELDGQHAKGEAPGTGLLEEQHDVESNDDVLVGSTGAGPLGEAEALDGVEVCAEVKPAVSDTSGESIPPMDDSSTQAPDTPDNPQAEYCQDQLARLVELLDEDPNKHLIDLLMGEMESNPASENGKEQGAGNDPADREQPSEVVSVVEGGTRDGEPPHTDTSAPPETHDEPGGPLEDPPIADDGEDREARGDLFWRVLERRQWGWATALAEAEGVRAPIPPWLVMALQLAHHTWGGSGGQLANERLLLLVSEHYKPSSEPDMQRKPGLTGVSLATASLLACFAPQLGQQANSWLADALQFDDAWVGLGATHDLLSGAQSVLAQVDPAAWRCVGDTQPLEQALRNTAEEVRTWTALLEVPRANYAPAGAALKAMAADPTGAIQPLLSIAASEDPSGVGELRKALAHFPSDLREFVEQRFIMYHRRRSHGKVRDVEGLALKWSIGKLDDLHGLALQWLATASQLNEARDPHSTAAATDFRKEWQRVWSSVCQELSATRLAGDDALGMRVVRRLLAGAVGAVAADIMDCEGDCGDRWPPAPLSPDLECEQVRWYVPGQWQVTLLDAGDAFPPTSASTDAIVAGYAQFAKGALSRVRELLEDGSYSLALRMLDYPQACPDISAYDFEALRDEAQDAAARAHEELRRRHDEMTNQLRDALAQGWLDSVAHREVDERLQKITQTLVRDSFDEDVVRRDLDGVARGLDEARRSRAEQVLQRAADISERVAGKPLDAAENAGEWLTQAAAHLRAQDVGLAEHALELAEEALQGRIQDVYAASCDELRNWLRVMPALQEWLESQHKATGQKVRDPLSLEGVSTPRRDQYRKATEAFRQLRRLDTEEPSARAAKTEGILRSLFGDFIGFEVEDVHTEGPRTNVPRQSFRMRTKPVVGRDQIPVPLFGSRAKGQYQIEVIWERPSAETLLQSLSEARPDDATFLVYVGRMTTRMRSVWLRKVPALGHGVPCILIDEMLLHYLGHQPGDRVRVLFDCALPYTTINPYQPTGPVQPELFYGREDDLQALEEPSGPCIVYGGRQLGKSALLRRLASRRHAPEKENWVVTEDIRDQDCLACWAPLRTWLKNQAKSKLPCQTPEQIARAVTKALEPSNRRLMLLLDEADSFIADDAGRNFENVWRLRMIMDNTDRRFKVILAGLQDVQRYSDSQNQPLAQMGRPVKIGPLPLEDATQLIRRPASSLGFEISPAAALKIRVYTDSHPGLIQYFCQQLLQQKVKYRAEAGREIVPVEATDVDLVYGQTATREEIKNRFSWTVVLDPLYKALVYSLLYLAGDPNESINRAFTPREALEITRGWCSGLMAEVTLKETASMLSELEGLGILQRVVSKDEEERWRVRNSQIIALMGGRTAIGDCLLEIGDQPRPAYPRPSEQHPRYGSDRLPCPLSLGELREIVGTPMLTEREPDGSIPPPRSGLLVLHTSLPLGGGRLREAVEAIYGDERVAAIPWEVCAPRSLDDLSPKALGEEIYGFLRKPYETGKLIWLQPGTAEDLTHSLKDYAAEVDAVIAGLRERPRPPVRVILQMWPQASWQWLLETRGGTLPGLCSVFQMRRWTTRDLEIWIRNEQFADPNSTLAEQVQKLTGGWYEAVMELRRHLIDNLGGELTHADPEPLLSGFDFSHSQSTLIEAGFVPVDALPGAAQYVWQNLGRAMYRSDVPLLSEISEGRFSTADCELAWSYLNLLGYLSPIGHQGTGGEIQYEQERIVAALLRGGEQDD
jgi:hypothetical protein